jgi:hypothetical protein
MFELPARRMRTAIAGRCAGIDFPDRCQCLRLAGQRCRCPPLRLQKLCNLVADRAEDSRYREADEQRERQQSGETDADPYQHAHPASGIGSASSFLKRMQGYKTMR